MGKTLTAEAVNTIGWLAGDVRSVAVPMFQRHYRWDADRCARLLADIRAAGVTGRGHFIGSVMATAEPEGVPDLTLIDGQQRVTTLMLLAAAVRHTLAGADPSAEELLHRVLVHPDDPGRTKLVTHRRQAGDLTAVVFTDPPVPHEPGASALADNYAFFLREVRDDPDRVWAGLRQLEHVVITLAQTANPQQVFESLNATAAPLLNHELIHNYVLMGLTLDQQWQVEDSAWSPIEANTGESIDAFWRDYLILRTGRDSEFRGEHGIYQAFTDQFPHLDAESLARHAPEWAEYSAVYRVLLDPALAGDEELSEHLRWVNVFGTALYPIVMAACADHRRGAINRADLLQTLEQLQSLCLRRMLVGESRDHLSAQLCRRRNRSGHPIREIVRRTPTDERIRSALRYRPLPHAGYVLQRLQDVSTLEGLEIEHIFPQTPGDTWTGDGTQTWAALTEAERAKYRELLQTIGNLTLLEQPLNAAAGNRPFGDKRDHYRCSAVPATAALARLVQWDIPAIEARTHDLTEQFLRTWPRPTGPGLEDPEHLVPILDAQKAPGWYPGWRTEYAYVKYGDELWEVHDIKTLFHRVFTRLWADHRPEVLAFTTAHGGPVFPTREWNGQWDAIDEGRYLFMGMFPQYMLSDLQRILDELGQADEVLIKYATKDE